MGGEWHDKEARTLLALLEAAPEYAPLLRALAEKGSLSTADVMRMLHRPIKQIAEVAGAQHHVISVNPVNSTVQLHGLAMAQVVKEEMKARSERSWVPRWLQ